AAIGRGRELGGKAVLADVALAELAHHFEVLLVDVGERDLDVAELGHREQIAHQGAGEADASGADEGNLAGGHGGYLSTKATRPSLQLKYDKYAHMGKNVLVGR